MSLPAWVFVRPAPTVVGTRRSRGGVVVGRQLPPGEGRAVGGHGWDGATTTTKDTAPAVGVRLTVEQAARLQTFPADYPWRGSRMQHCQQIGNAVPPLLARVIVAGISGMCNAAATACPCDDHHATEEAS